MGNNMPKTHDNYRYERKFVISQLDRHEIESLIKLHPAMFDQAYPPRFVNNIYFDSFDLKYYYGTTAGDAARVKVRIRWYGNLADPIEKPILEFKIKRGLLGTKQSFPLPPFQLDETFDATSISSIVQASELPEELKLQLLYLRPWLINRYHRQYYRSADNCFRLTLDTQMQWYDVTASSISLGPRHTDQCNTVMELKYDQINDHKAPSIANAFPFRMTKNSKYTNGIEKVVLIGV